MKANMLSKCSISLLHIKWYWVNAYVFPFRLLVFLQRRHKLSIYVSQMIPNNYKWSPMFISEPSWWWWGVEELISKGFSDCFLIILVIEFLLVAHKVRPLTSWSLTLLSPGLQGWESRCNTSSNINMTRRWLLWERDLCASRLPRIWR